MSNYKVIFDGTTSPGHSVDQVKQGLCLLFKKDRAAIDKLFTGRPVAIKRNIDRSMARKIKNAMEQAGAICRIEIIAETRGSAGDAAPAALKSKTQDPLLITPVKCAALLQYAPLTCPEISAWDKGINLNRKDRQEVLFSEIRMVSVFEDRTDTAHPLKCMFYMHDRPRPLLVNGEKIRFKDFPGGSCSSLVESLRAFLKLLVNRHHEMILDIETHRFLQKGRPQFVDNGIDAFAATLGKALETQAPATAAGKKESREVANTFLPGTGMEGETATTQSHKATSKKPVKVKQIKPELTPEQHKTLRSRHRRKAFVFLVLSVFFGVGFVGTTSNLYQELNRGTSQSSFFGNIGLHTPAVQRQQEFLDYNRKMSKVTTTLSLIVCFVLAIFFFSKSRHHFCQARE